jgi:hypothetical protein
MEVILGLLSTGAVIHSGDGSDGHQPTDVVVRWRADRREALRLGSRSAEVGQQLLANINAQLEELSVEQFCERWDVESPL